MMCVVRCRYLLVMVVCGLSLSGCDSSQNPPTVDDTNSSQEPPRENAPTIESAYSSLFNAPSVTLTQLEEYEAALEKVYTEADSITSARLQATHALSEHINEQGGLEEFERINNELSALWFQRFDSKTELNSRRSQGLQEAETAIIYVNGIWNTYVDFEQNQLALRNLIERNDASLPSVLVDASYNRSARESCVVLLGELLDSGTSDRWIVLPALMCALPSASFDVVTTILAHVLDLIQVQDTHNLRTIIETHLQENRRIIIVSHSDGNHVTRDALASLDDDSLRSVGVVMVGSPVELEDMPNSVFARWIGLSGDTIAWLGLAEVLDPGVSCLSLFTTAIQMGAQCAADIVSGDPLETMLSVLLRFGGKLLETGAECEFDLLSNNIGSNGHGFSSSYIEGDVSGPAIINAIADLRCKLELPDGGFGDPCQPSQDDHENSVFGAGRPLANWLLLSGTEENEEINLMESRHGGAGEQFPAPVTIERERFCASNSFRSESVNLQSLTISSLNNEPVDGRVAFTFTSDQGPLGCSNNDRLRVVVDYWGHLHPGEVVSLIFEVDQDPPAPWSNVDVVDLSLPNGDSMRLSNDCPTYDTDCIDFSRGPLERTWAFDELPNPRIPPAESVGVAFRFIIQSFANTHADEGAVTSSRIDYRWRIEVR